MTREENTDPGCSRCLQDLHDASYKLLTVFNLTQDTNLHVINQKCHSARIANLFKCSWNGESEGLFHHTFLHLVGSSFNLPSRITAQRGRPAAPSSHSIMKPIPVAWPDKEKQRLEESELNPSDYRTGQRNTITHIPSTKVDSHHRLLPKKKQGGPLILNDGENSCEDTFN